MLVSTTPRGILPILEAPKKNVIVELPWFA